MRETLRAYGIERLHLCGIMCARDTMVESRGKDSMCTLYRETLYVYDSIGCERHSITVCVSVCVYIYMV